MSLFLAFCVARAEAPLLAGVRLDALAPLLISDVATVDGDDAWKGVAPGGWVLHRWSPDIPAAQAGFRFTAATIQAPLPPLTLLGADEAVGDAHLVVARRANVVIEVRGDDAPGLARAVLAAESAEIGVLSPAEGVDRDAFGRRLASSKE